VTAEEREIIQALDKELAPYWARKLSLHNEVAQTQRADWRLRGDKDVVTAWQAADRRGLFAELDRLALAYGPTCSRRKEAKRQSNALASLAKRIQTLLKRKAGKARTPQHLGVES
jgi:hypothetical protein